MCCQCTYNFCSFYTSLTNDIFLRVPWTTRRSNQSILMEISPGCSLEGMMLKLKAKAPVLWPPHKKSWLIGKDYDSGRDWGQEDKGMTEDEMAGWHHWLDGRESEWTPGIGDGQGSLACCNSWGRKESDTTERLKWTEMNIHPLAEFLDHMVVLFLVFWGIFLIHLIAWVSKWEKTFIQLIFACCYC